MVDDALAGLDPAQIEAVTTPSTLVAVIAGAGSGKTRVLTSRIAFRIAAGTADAAHTLALTFTREAAGELRRRLRRSGVHDHVEAGTFHAVALALVRQRRRDLDRPPLTVADDRDRLLAVVADGIPVTHVGDRSGLVGRPRHRTRVVRQGRTCGLTSRRHASRTHRRGARRLRRR